MSIGIVIFLTPRESRLSVGRRPSDDLCDGAAARAYFDWRATSDLTFHAVLMILPCLAYLLSSLLLL
jgi:hypothetical protein